MNIKYANKRKRSNAVVLSLLLLFHILSYKREIKKLARGRHIPVVWERLGNIHEGIFMLP